VSEKCILKTTFLSLPLHSLLSCLPSILSLRAETARQVSAIMAGSDNKMYLDAESLMINVADSTGSTKRLKDFGPK
jgi:hypothetical protein